MKHKEDVIKWIKLFYSVYSVNIIIGLVKIIILSTLMEYSNLILAIKLVAYLTFYPFMLVIPIQLISLKTKISLIDWIKTDHSRKKIASLKGFIKIGVLVVYPLIISLSYLLVEYIV